MDLGKTDNHAPSLSGSLHPLFDSHNWRKVPADRRRALLPSRLLASNLIRAAMPFIAQFLPQPKYENEKDGSGPVQPPDRIALTKSRMDSVSRLLDGLSGDVVWGESNRMWAVNGYLGLTTATNVKFDPDRYVDSSQDWPQYWNSASAKDRRMGYKSRQMRIYIMSRFADALLASEPGSEQHLRTTFHAGVTIAHEIGHFIRNYRFTNNTPQTEGTYDRDVDSECGLSLEAFLFSGFIPMFERFGSLEDELSFRGVTCWQKHPTTDGPRSALFEPHSGPEMNHNPVGPWVIHYSMYV